MLKKHAKAVDTALRGFDLTVLVAALPIAYFVRDSLLASELNGLFPIDHYWPVAALTVLLWMGASSVARVYGNYRRRRLGDELGRLARAGVLVGGGIGAFAFFTKQNDVSRLLVALYASLALAMLMVNRVAVRLIARSVRRSGRNRRRFAVVGTGPFARRVVAVMTRDAGWGFDFAGYVVEGETVRAPEGTRVLGALCDLLEILRNEVVDELLIASPGLPSEATSRALVVSEQLGIPARICMDFPDLRVAKATLDEVDGIPTVALSPVPDDVMALGAKRLFDVAVSTVALLSLAPLLLTVAIAIRIESKGPVLFRQRRVGKNGRIFLVLKFRSMYPDAEQRLEALRQRNEMSGPVFKLRDDPRVTRVGRWIRRTSIDELPQFWNVLRGDMSVVGPRPPLPSEVRQYEAWQVRRLSVRPGITCTWQVSGRNDIDFDRWMQLDLEYIDRWSLWRDFRIVLKTIPAIFNGR